MPRPEKVQAVEEIKERFADASASFITEYRGLTVGQQQSLRNSLREAGASYTVFKLTLTKLALDQLGNSDLDEFLSGPTAIAFASSDPVPVAKALKDFGDENEALVIKAGWMNGEVLLPEMVAKLASLESRAALLAKIAGAAKAPLIKMAGMLGSMTRDAASMFSQLLDKKEDAVPEPVEQPIESSGEESGPDAEPVDTATEESEAPVDDSGTDEPAEAEAPVDEASKADTPESGAPESGAPESGADTEIKNQEEPAAEESSSDEDESAPAEAADDDTADDDAAEEE